MIRPVLPRTSPVAASHRAMDALAYDKRAVSFEALHAIAPSHFDTFVAALSIEDGQLVMDAGCGYGAVTRESIARNPNRRAHYLLIDLSSRQLARARSSLASQSHGQHPARLSYLQHRIERTPLRSESVDTVAAKMLLHELSERDQHDAMAEIHRVLRPGGLVAIWDIALQPEAAAFSSWIIREKDALAGYSDLVKHRYFPTQDGWQALLRGAGFNQPDVRASIAYTFSTRVFAQHDLRGDGHLLRTWHDRIRTRVTKTPDHVLRAAGYADNGQDISVVLPIVIMCVTKWKQVWL